MAESKNNVVTHGMSGKLDLIVFSQRNGKTVVSKAPRRSKTTSAAQQEVQETFQQAVIYAKAALADTATKTAYKASAEIGQSAYNVAIADFFNAPDIQEVDLSTYTGKVGDSIKIKVTDDFKVAAVHVKIENPDASLVEEGEATNSGNGLDWLYTATANNSSLVGDKITVTATDTPGNDTEEQKVLS